MKVPNMAGFVGHDGDNVWLEPSQQHEDDSALVRSRPDLFDDDSASYEVAELEPEPEQPVRRGPGRPKAKPHDKPHSVD